MADDTSELCDLVQQAQELLTTVREEIDSFWLLVRDSQPAKEQVDDQLFTIVEPLANLRATLEGLWSRAYAVDDESIANGGSSIKTAINESEADNA